MTVASPELLHRVVHRAALGRRDEDDWWGSPIDSALASVALARHQRAFRADAVRAVARLERWWKDGEPRPISADVAALALSARAKAELQQTDATLTTAAVDAVAGLARRDPSLAPELHLALCAWALDRLVPDRQAAPWPELRRRFSRGRAFGVEEPLRSYGAALSTHPFDAAAVTQALLGEVGASPSATDGVILIWLLTAAIERAAETLPETDSGLRVLVEQRAGLVERLASEVHDSTFKVPEIRGFDPHEEDLGQTPLYLSPMEALLLDASLASREAETPWLTFDEAERLFGERARISERAASRERGRLLNVIATFAFAFSLAAGASTGLALNISGRDPWVAANIGVAVVAALAFLSVMVLQRVRETAADDAAAVFTGSLAFVAGVDAWNQTRRHPFLPDALGLTLGIVIPAAVALLSAIVRHHLLPRHGRRDSPA